MSLDTKSESGEEDRRIEVPVSWAALEDAFENNAPEVHSYLHLVTGEVIRVVDGVAAPMTHARIASDPGYRRVDPVSSREQYRWMERFIATLGEGPLKQRLLHAIDGKGAFRRFKDVLVSFPVERERWFAFRSERLRMCMEGWLDAQGLKAVDRPEWEVPGAEQVRTHTQAEQQPAERAPVRKPRVGGTEALRLRAMRLVETLAPHELEAACLYLEFLRDRSPPVPPAPEPAASEAQEEPGGEGNGSREHAASDRA